MCTFHRQIVMAVSLTFVAAALFGCHGGEADDPAAAVETVERALAPRDVELVIPEVRTEHPTVQLLGEVRPFDTVMVSSEVAGKIDRVLVEVGDRIAAGTPLVEVDRSTFRIYLQQAKANLAAARADLELATKELERKRDLRSDETIPQSAFDQAEAAHELAAARSAAAEAALDLAARNFDRSIVRAPAAGAITQRMVVAGQWADVGVGLFEFAIGGKVKISTRVPESWAPKLAGLESFTFTAGTDTVVRTARVYSIQPVVMENSRSFEIIGTAASDGSMRPGMFANVTLVAPAAEESLWLPTTAVATSDLPQVLMVEDGLVVYRKVRVGRRSDGLIEISDGLTADAAVIKDVSGLSRGLPVRVVE